MLKKVSYLACVGLLVWGVSACSDDSENKTTSDGPVSSTDLSQSTSDLPQNPGTEAGSVQQDSQVPAADAFVPICEEGCHAESSALCVTNPATSQCVECLQDAHCVGNPDAEGAVCDTTANKCVECLQDAHCANHPGGAKCQEQSCLCDTDADCSGGFRFGPKCVALISYSRCGCESDSECSQTTSGSVCMTDLNHKCVCHSHTDCAANSSATACHKPYYYADYGLCGAPCRSDDGCQKEKMTKCDTVSGGCVQCASDAHCQNVDDGHKCLANECSCETEADCPAGWSCEDYLGTVSCWEP